MKPSLWPLNIKHFFKGFPVVEFFILISVICILAAILLPAFAKAKERAEQIEANKKVRAEQLQRIETFQVGDTVKVTGLDEKGVINYIHGSDNTVDVLMKSVNGTPVIIQNVNPKLLSK